MLHIFCPHCGELRSEEEFHASGQAHIPRPLDPASCTDEEWGDYMFFRDNPRGLHHELWIHAAGCRQYFNATRDTVTYEILETYKIGTKPHHRQDRQPESGRHGSGREGMSQINRLSNGGRIDRNKVLSFTFNGQSYKGYEGDSLAAALIANGVDIIGRSFKYSRPRHLRRRR